MSKIIYRPKGKAQEYAKYAANFYNGCSGKCEYCYNRTGITAKILGGDKPTLKKSLQTATITLQIFSKELQGNLIQLQKHGLFFNFVSDPCLQDTYWLNSMAIRECLAANVPVIVLTKQTWWATMGKIEYEFDIDKAKRLIAFGFTLTGHDELEPGCATNADRVIAMKQLHDAGFKTWASIEPIIDFDSSFRMMEQTFGSCDLYKVGLRSGSKYSAEDARWFAVKVLISCACNHTKVYLKDSLVKLTELDRETFKEIHSSYVGADYNLFAE